MLNEPLELEIPDPETRDTSPPVMSVLCPALSTKRPPAPESPWPTEILVDPAVPDK